jgi:integrase
MALTDIAIRQLKPKEKNYKVSDGEGLNLLVRTSGTKSWQLKYRFAGKEKSLTLGTYPTTSLKDARKRKTDAQQKLSNNIDPSFAKQSEKSELKKIHDGKFKSISTDWYNNQLPRWTEKYAKKTDQTLSNWVYPKLNNTPIANITSRDLLLVLRDMEAAGIGETTRKVKSLLENIFMFAIVEGHIENNPATGLEKALKATPRVKHQRALPIIKLGEFVHKIEQDIGHPVIRLSLLLLLHTNVRTNKIRYAEWQDFDLKKKIWTIPANKIKMQSEHRVPLNKQAMEILKDLKSFTGHQNWIAKSPNTIDKPISENALLCLVRRIKMKKYTTVHGLRATASTFLNDQGYRPDVIETQLAHQERNQVRKAYNHAEYWEERKQMSKFWGEHILSSIKKHKKKHNL